MPQRSIIPFFKDKYTYSICSLEYELIKSNLGYNLVNAKDRCRRDSERDAVLGRVDVTN